MVVWAQCKQWGTTMLKLECLTRFSELMLRKRSQTSQWKPSEPKEWSETKEGHEGAIEIWKE